MSEGTPTPDKRTPGESDPDDAFDLESGESETAPRDERTPKEWREKLRGLITGAKEKLGMSERGERLTSYLKDRSAKLDASAGELGMVEKSFRALGERYNKLGWKSKLGVGLALGIGSAAFSGVSLPIAFACTSGLALQRVAGMASVFLKYEKKGKALGKEGGLLAQKEKAFLKAMLYSTGMSLAIGEAVSLASESSYGEAVHEWLKQNWPFGQAEDVGAGSARPDAPPAEAPSAELEPEISQPADESVSSEPATQAPAPRAEASASAVPASEEVPASPSTEPAGNPEVASADTESANLVAKEFGAEYAGSETAPEVAAQTDLSAQEWRAEYAEPVNHTSTPDWRAEHTESDFAPETLEETPATAEAAPQAPITEEVVTAPNVVPSDTLSAMPETPPVTAPEANHFVVNAHGIEVTTSEPHIYADAGKEHMFIYGGSPDQQARLIGQYFENPANANHTLYGADASNVSFRVPWHMVNGEVLPGEPVRTGGLFGFFSSFMEPPHPDEFAERIQFQPTEMPVTSINPDNIPRAEMPPIAPNPDDIPRANMPPANTGDEFSRPEMRVDKQNIPPSPEINPHPLAHIESGSVRGEFGYSSDGTVTSLNTAGIAHGEFKTLLNDNYGEVLVNRPGGNVGLARSVVENRARDIFNRTQVLDELVKRGAGGSPEASFLRKSIDSVIEQTEKMYGDVFKDMHR